MAGFDLSKIDGAIAGLKKDLGADVEIAVNEVTNIPRVKCKSPTIGYIFGGGGTPIGKIIELYGPESSGKTLIAQNILADFQREGKFVAFVDAEFSFDSKWAQIQGLDVSPEKFRLFQPNCGEDAFTIVEKLAESGQVGCIAVDSIAALVPKAELEGEMTDQQMGLQARVIGKGLRKIAGICSKNGTTVVFLNQLRMAIGIVFGNPEVTPGGKALSFWSSIRCEVRKGKLESGEDKEKDDSIGIGARIRNVKNKTSVPFRRGEIFISFTDGVDTDSEYINFAISLGIIERKGAWYTIPNGERAQGNVKLKELLLQNSDVFDSIKEQVENHLAGNPIEDIKLEERLTLEEE